MSVIGNVLRYHARVYARTNKFIMPFSALLIALSGIYAYSPFRPVEAFAFSSTVCFFIMVWIGFTYPEIEDPVSQQLLVLKVRSEAKYWVCNILFMFLLAACVSLFAVLFPIIPHVAKGFTLFRPQLTVSDAGFALILHVLVSCMGIAVGMFFHPRIFPDRKAALLFALFLTVLGSVKIGIHRAFPPAAVITWLLPPVSDITGIFAGKDAFALQDIALAALWAALYASALLGGQVYLLIKKKF